MSTKLPNPIIGLTLLAPELRHEDDARRSLTTTAAGVVIGGAWQPKPPALAPDAERLQAALLERRTAAARPWFMRLIGRAWAWM